MGYIRHFQIVGNLLYAANMDTGLEIYDISNVNNPKLLGCFHDGGRPSYIHVVEDYAYIADFDDGLEIIDVSNPKKMVEIGEFHEEGDYIRAMQVVDNLAYIIDVSGDGLEIIQLWWNSKEDWGTDIFALYENKDYAKILHYIEQETQEFLKLYHSS